MQVPEHVVAVSRRHAVEHHMPHYWSGKPCIHGHRSYRYASTGGCMECLRTNVANLRKATGGWVKLVLTIHRDDVAAVQSYAATLAAARIEAQRTAMAVAPLPPGFSIHPAFTAAMAVGADVTLTHEHPPCEMMAPKVSDCGLCGHPTRWGQACALCGTVMAPG